LLYVKRAPEGGRPESQQWQCPHHQAYNIDTGVRLTSTTAGSIIRVHACDPLVYSEVVLGTHGKGGIDIFLW